MQPLESTSPVRKRYLDVNHSRQCESRCTGQLLLTHSAVLVLNARLIELLRNDEGEFGFSTKRRVELPPPLSRYERVALLVAPFDARS